METEKRTRTNDDLLGKMWKTKSARFNAHLRLRRKHNLSTWATSILAFYIFAASLIPLVYTSLASGGAERLISVLTVIISVFLIIITLLEGSKRYDSEADRMLNCGLEISEIYNRFQALNKEKADERRTEFNNEYSAVMNRYGLNHEDVDFLKFKMANRAELRTDWSQFLFDSVKYLVLWIGEYWLYIVLVVIPPLTAVLLRRQLGF
ncbi:SLATT domain-containing protein [Rhodopseudomonas palustris]|uniref:SLATT domain-containing protein n=1 Tax=Rhodopseudomonas palustris TaxID=1076 RepID=UPI0024C6D3EE|nr:SLATT domain-containing protein [Rhodopseudomonas palustris]